MAAFITRDAFTPEEAEDIVGQANQGKEEGCSSCADKAVEARGKLFLSFRQRRVADQSRVDLK